MTDPTPTAEGQPAQQVATRPQRAALETGGKIMAIVPQNMEAAFRLANAIAAAGVAPKSYNNDANKIMVGIMHGLEAGLPPMAALQSIAVINGMPTIWGDGMLALVRASGLMASINEVLDGTGDLMRAVCTVRRHGEPDPIVRTFSVGDAKLAGLWGKRGQGGQPTPWVTYPQRMLAMRARSWALRDGFADVLKGLVPREEAHDLGPLVEEGDGYVPPRPTRREFTGDPAAAGHEDLDAKFRETVGPVVDPQTGDITETQSAAASQEAPAADASAGEGGKAAALDPGTAAPAEAATAGAPDEVKEETQDWATTHKLIVEHIAMATDADELKRWFTADSFVKDLKQFDATLYSDAVSAVNTKIKQLRAK